MFIIIGEHTSNFQDIDVSVSSKTATRAEIFHKIEREVELI